MANSDSILVNGAIGGHSDPRPGRRFVVEAGKLSSNDQAVPVRVIHGRETVAGVHIMPVFNWGAEEITTSVGK